MTRTAVPPHALVLTAGLGTRLRPLTLVRAKPAIPVAGQPLVSRIIRWLTDNDVREIILNLHYLPETIATIVGDGGELGAHVRYSWEQPMVLGSAGGPRQALDIVGADTFFLINGDTLTDLDLGEFAESHARSGAQVTLALVPNVEPLRYGGVKLNERHEVIGFAPKGSSAESFHFIGAQIARRSVFEHLTPGKPEQSIGGCYDALLQQEPGSIRGFVTKASFWDIGTVSDYWHTSFAWAGEPSQVSPAHDAQISRSILWDDVKVDAGARITECIVTDGVHVSADTHYSRRILRRSTGGETIVEPLEID